MLHAKNSEARNTVIQGSKREALFQKKKFFMLRIVRHEAPSRIRPVLMCFLHEQTLLFGRVGIEVVTKVVSI